MTCVFKAPIESKLINALKRHLSINVILELTGLDLDKIFTNCWLEIPTEYEPNVGWLMVWDPKKFPINKEHIDLVQIVLKYAWSYSISSSNERLRTFLNNELTMFDAGMKLHLIHQQQIKASKKGRSWKALDNWISRQLRKKKWLQQELWDALPESYEGKAIYRDGDEVCCTKKSRNPIKFRAFCDHIRKMKKKKYTDNDVTCG